MEFDIVFDDVVYWLQRTGGIATYWNELTSRVALQARRTRHIAFSTPPRAIVSNLADLPVHRQRLSPRIGRYLRAPVGPLLHETVFHSSYYRRPSSSDCLNIVTVHDFTYEKYRRGVARAVHSLQKFAAIRAADVVICVSRHTRDDLVRYLPEVDPKRVVVIHHGVSEQFFPQAGSHPAGTPYYLYVGDRSVYKRFDLAVEAVRRVGGFLKFTGQAPSAAETQLLRSALGVRWHHEGCVSPAALNSLYNGAEAFLYPSDHEGFGMPLLESMRAGCPVVCAPLTSLPEVGGNAAIFASEQTGEAYAAALLRLHEQTFRRGRIAAGMAHAAAFTWAQCAQETVGAYRLASQLRRAQCFA